MKFASEIREIEKAFLTEEEYKLEECNVIDLKVKEAFTFISIFL